MRAGDAAPYLDRDMYVLLGFEPAYDLLPRHDAAVPISPRPLAGTVMGHA